MFHAQIPFELKELKADDGLMQFSGYASVYGILDHVGDVVMRGAFDDTLAGSRKRKLLWQHDLREPVGIEQSLVSDEKGLFGTWKLSRTTRGLDAYELLKDGAVDSLSIGYQASDFEYDDAGTRLLKGIDLLEVSLVSIPALDEALITQVKAEQPFDILLEQVVASLTLGVREAKALHARRSTEQRELSERHAQAIRDLLTEAKASAADLEALLPAEAKAESADLAAVTPEDAATAAAASALSAPDLRLRLQLARHRLRLGGPLERAS